jgi:hypothetical protein
MIVFYLLCLLAALRGLGTATAGLASLASGGRGGKRVESVVTAPKPLVVWGYEPSPFCKGMRSSIAICLCPFTD